MTASFIGNNRALLGSQQGPLSFVFSSDFIQESTKSLLEVCFRFWSTYFNKFVSYPLQWQNTYPFNGSAEKGCVPPEISYNNDPSFVLLTSAVPY